MIRVLARALQVMTLLAIVLGPGLAAAQGTPAGAPAAAPQPPPITAPAAPAVKWDPVSESAIYVLMGFILLVVLLVVGMLIRMHKTKSDSWSLSDALSEPTELSDANNPGQKFTGMRASSSRLIALLGSVTVVSLYLGYGFVLLWGFARTGGIPGGVIDDLGKFLLGGVGLFTPYVANKISNAFK